MITKLFTNRTNPVFSQYKLSGKEVDEAIDLSRINIFVGANNTGKSRFLRELFISFHEKEINNKEKYSAIDFIYIDIKKAKEEFDVILNSYKSLSNDTNTNYSIDINKIKNFNDRIENKKHEDSLSFIRYYSLLEQFEFRKDGIVNNAMKEHNNLYEILVHVLLSS